MNQSLSVIQTKYLIQDQKGQIIGLKDAFTDRLDNVQCNYLVELFSFGYFATDNKSTLEMLQYALTNANVDFRIIYNEDEYEIFV